MCAFHIFKGGTESDAQDFIADLGGGVCGEAACQTERNEEDSHQNSPGSLLTSSKSFH
jgi:hypothetical protein